MSTIWASPDVISKLTELLKDNENKPAIQASRDLSLGIAALLDDLKQPTSLSLLSLWPAAAGALPYVWHADARNRLYAALGGEP